MKENEQGEIVEVSTDNEKTRSFERVFVGGVGGIRTYTLSL